jgi:hypothetical protein
VTVKSGGKVPAHCDQTLELTGSFGDLGVQFSSRSLRDRFGLATGKPLTLQATPQPLDLTTGGTLFNHPQVAGAEANEISS